MAKKYGKWQIIKTLDEGGQAAIFLARHVDSPEGPIRALKRLKNVGRRLDRFKREIETVNGLDHSGIIKIVDSDTSGSEPYFVMPYYEHGNCEKAGVLEWPIEKRLHFFRDILDSMSTVHGRRIIHRDLKPANILVTNDNKPVLTDFGICFVEDGRLITLTEVVGPRHFIAPELERGEDAGTPSDIYSLGKVLYWLVSGGEFLVREEHRSSQYDLTRLDHRFEIVSELLDKMVVDDPRKRLGTGSEAFMAFDKKLKDFRAVINYPSSTGPQPCRYCGLSDYQPMTTVQHDGSMDAVELQGKIGIRSYSSIKLRVLVCPRCGNVQTFHIPSSDEHTLPWRPRTPI